MPEAFPDIESLRKKPPKACGCLGGFANEIEVLDEDFVIIVFK